MPDLMTDLMARLGREADGCYSWSNGPGDIYAEHTHSHEKVLYCVDGSITFTLASQEIHLGPGDRMVLPPRTAHGAVVGPKGCTCIEGRGRNMASR